MGFALKYYARFEKRNKRGASRGRGRRARTVQNRFDEETAERTETSAEGGGGGEARKNLRLIEIHYSKRVQNVHDRNVGRKNKDDASAAVTRAPCPPGTRSCQSRTPRCAPWRSGRGWPTFYTCERTRASKQRRGERRKKCASPPPPCCPCSPSSRLNAGNAGTAEKSIPPQNQTCWRTRPQSQTCWRTRFRTARSRPC